MKAQTLPPQNPQLPPPKAIAAALKRIIEDAYDTGITRVLTFDINDQGIVFGRFHDDDQVYDYQIKPTGEIKYNEAEANGKRSDSLLIGYYVDSGALLRNSLQTRADASPRRTGKPKCKNSKRCKGSCIARGFECDTKLSPLATTRFQGVRQAIAAMKGRQTPGAAGDQTGSGKNQKSTVKNTQNQKSGSKQKGKGSLAGAAAVGVGALAAAGVAGAIAANRKEIPDQPEPAPLLKRPSGTTVATIAAGAAMLGVPAAAYTATVIRYRKNLDNSAMKAIEEAENYEAPDEVKGGFRPSHGGRGLTLKKEAEQITLLANGFSGSGGSGGDFFAAQFSRSFKKHHVVGVENPEFDIPEKEKRTGSELTRDNLVQMLKTVTQKGENEVAIRMAARAYAYHKKHPDKPINLIGYSAGGMVSNEAAELLKRMGVEDVRVANMGSPHYGLVSNRALNFVADDDPASAFPGFNPPNKAKLKNPVGSHTSYFVHEQIETKYNPRIRQFVPTGKSIKRTNKEIMGLIHKHFTRHQRQDAISNDPTPNESPIAVCR